MGKLKVAPIKPTIPYRVFDQIDIRESSIRNDFIQFSEASLRRSCLNL